MRIMRIISRATGQRRTSARRLGSVRTVTMGSSGAVRENGTTGYVYVN